MVRFGNPNAPVAAAPVAAGQGFLRLIDVLGLVLSGAIALLLPLGYFTVSYTALVSTLEAETMIKAELIDRLISVEPSLWQFQVHRLNEIMVRFPTTLETERALIRDVTGVVLVDTKAPLPVPVVLREAPVFDSGVLAGRIELQRSLQPVAIKTALTGLLGLLLAGSVFGIIRTLRIREHSIMEARYEEQERAHVTLQSIGDAVITTDGNERIDYLNPVAESLVGWRLAQARGQRLSHVMPLIDEHTLEPAPDALGQALCENDRWSRSKPVALRRPDGSTISIDDSAAPIRDRRGQVVGGVLVFHDVTVARSIAQRIRWAATHDALTGLVNRREFESRVEEALATARNSDKHHTLCYLDLDRFKIVNDTAGHAAGDALLKEISALLQEKLRESDTLARLGGDEFGVLLESCPLDRAELIAADLLAAVKGFRLNWEGQVFSVGISIGLVGISGGQDTQTEVFSAADAACYAAKEQGRNRIHVFRRTDAAVAERRREMDWAVKLCRALEEDRFVLFYQSYRALATADARADVKHIEILLRLIDEDGSLVLPANFLPTAERYSLISAIDNWVIATTCSRYADLVALLGAPLTCGINLSSTSLNSDELPGFIREQARLHGLPPGRSASR
ncbi:PAS domain S-box-containing protein/diguanylate cyclase (GGDEF)-like protein [Thiocapsa rosea]|uniref:PAS domain S-box-containing protein/diguanylate cyclase (GGDEF)-like protein n=1 Tax=Thiocapsa rosea TaxID=69360 RepID=A0A495V6S9_9GAMM|nr:PAS domain S-box-containing protein/diguanylate cyclase (GGDEF)-like protein [Thiocapsa rosea]